MIYIEKDPAVVTPSLRRNQEGDQCKPIFNSSLKKNHHDNQAESFASVEQLNADIATALEFEKFLARKQYHVRRFILNLKVKRDSLAEIGKALA